MYWKNCCGNDFKIHFDAPIPVGENKCPYCDSEFNDNAELLKHVQKVHLGSVYSIRADKVTAWCEECDEVFDEMQAMNKHKVQTGHKVKVIEFSTWEGFR
jgi:uncharacterized C2H2 Zn-finger protein